MSRCAICGKVHEELPLVLAFKRPADFFKVPEAEQAARIKINDDLCVIDGREFLIRGVLEIPIPESADTFDWGVWAGIAQDDFERCIDLWDSEEAHLEPAFSGTLSGGLPPYPESDGLAIRIQLRSDNDRPLFIVESSTHPLGFDQKNGISLAKAHSFLAMMVPHLFVD